MEQTKFTRREFSKALLASFGLLCLPSFGGEQIVIEDVLLEDGWRSSLTLQASDNPLGISASIDIDKALQYVALVDNSGHRWHSLDGGVTWRSGFREFSLELED